VSDLGEAEQQLVEIAKALYKNAKVVIMDEPTASLTRAEINHLFELIHQLKKQRVSVIYISHRLDEIFEIADCVTVFRDGKKVHHAQIENITKEKLIKSMIGSELHFTQIGKRDPGEKWFTAENLTKHHVFQDIDLSLNRGEIVGIAGMVGSGKSELAQALSGVLKLDTGKLTFAEKELTNSPLKRFISEGICFVPAERDTTGLVQSMNVAGNITLANLKGLSVGPILNLKQERTITNKYIEIMNIVCRDMGQEVQFLSGGNRQKVMLAKWLSLGIKLFIMDEPTQGVDVGAREEIHQIMRGLINEGKTILMVTSDFDELLNMTHRILVMNKGKIVTELETASTSQKEVLEYAIGR
jgi:ABC-type sugar transport system ATPase subunit